MKIGSIASLSCLHLLLASLLSVNSLVPVPTTKSRTVATRVYFGIPSFGPKDGKKEITDDKDDKKKISFSGLLQVITAGMGAPFLGDYEGVDEETGKFMFSLEANNLVDEVRFCNI